jgi:hypothetical protein
MKFDINEIVAQMISAIKGEVAKDWEVVKSTVNGLIQAKKDRLELLTSLRLANQISDKDFKQRLVNEEMILESELHAIAIIAKVTAQNAANAAIDILNKAIEKALRL